MLNFIALIVWRAFCGYIKIYLNFNYTRNASALSRKLELNSHRFNAIF